MRKTLKKLDKRARHYTDHILLSIYLSIFICIYIHSKPPTHSHTPSRFGEAWRNDRCRGEAGRGDALMAMRVVCALFRDSFCDRSCDRSCDRLLGEAGRGDVLSAAGAWVRLCCIE